MSREQILKRIATARRQLHAPGYVVDERLAAHPRGPLPRVPTDLVGEFAARARVLASTVLGPVPRHEAPRTVAAYLAQEQLGTRAVVWPALAELDWSANGIVAEPRAARGDDETGITGAYCAIAETGTLLLLSGPDTPAAASLLPATHIALVPIERIVAHMEDAFDLLRRELGSVPRAINFVSGPSRTADVEQTVTLGAHGPSRVAVILVD